MIALNIDSEIFPIHPLIFTRSLMHCLMFNALYNACKCTICHSRPSGFETEQGIGSVKQTCRESLEVLKSSEMWPTQLWELRSTNSHSQKIFQPFCHIFLKFGMSVPYAFLDAAQWLKSNKMSDGPRWRTVSKFSIFKSL